MFCSQCGGEITEGAAFCPSCGAPQGAQTPPTRRKHRWLIPAIVGGVVLVAALVVIAAFALGIGKSGPAVDPLVGAWSIALKTDAREEPFLMGIEVEQDGSFVISGELRDMIGLSGAYSQGIWSLVETKDGYRTYDVRFEGEGDYRARIPADGFAGTWELLLGDERMYATLSEDSLCEVGAPGTSVAGLWAKQDTTGGTADLTFEFQTYGVVCTVNHTQDVGAASTGAGVGGGESDTSQGPPSQLVDFESAASCNATCHTPMDAYVTTANQEPSSPGTDKWGNTVANTAGMLCVSHKAQGYDCLSCHQLTEVESGSLANTWDTGNYVDPLEERDLGMLVEAQGIEPDQFCLNEACHNLTRDDLISATSDRVFNPHDGDQHGEIECGECHKAHRASVNYCTGCHREAEVPQGWLLASEARDLNVSQ